MVSLLFPKLCRSRGNKESKGVRMSKELLITEPEYDRIVIKVKGARVIFFKQWDLETGKVHYKWMKIDDVIWGSK